MTSDEKKLFKTVVRQLSDPIPTWIQSTPKTSLPASLIWSATFRQMGETSIQWAWIGSVACAVRPSLCFRVR